MVQEYGWMDGWIQQYECRVCVCVCKCVMLKKYSSAMHGYTVLVRPRAS
jgi:hypothetical protein